MVASLSEDTGLIGGIPIKVSLRIFKREPRESQSEDVSYYEVLIERNAFFWIDNQTAKERRDIE